ncbi:unnamed protein product [Spodoptera littoralis]|uniref:Uncharacterized protein n=1 Tax=Spodoptera littoralis TaxID=7109 RepID=A0A9P0N5X2_SPOLI|nr:unnamed protein product [Spodoptera littoralis]CAH1642665.1 unnamed protein product [Spodoptera littoralis]
MKTTRLILLLALFLHYSLVNSDDLHKPDNFNETELMENHQERMKMVNAFFRDLKIVLNKNKKPLRSMKETERNDKGVKDTKIPILRARLFTPKSIQTKSTLKLHKFPNYVSKPLFPIPVLTENILRTSATSVSTPKSTIKINSTTKPSSVTIKPKQVGHASTFTSPSIPRNFFDKIFQKVTFSTHRVPEQFTFRSVISPSKPTSKTVTTNQRSTFILTTSKTKSTRPSTLAPTKVTSPNITFNKLAVVKFNQIYNLKEEVESFTSIKSTSSSMSTTPSSMSTTPSSMSTTPSSMSTTPSSMSTTPSSMSTTPSSMSTTPSSMSTTSIGRKTFNNIATFIPELSFYQRLHLFTPISRIIYEVTTTSSPPKTSASLAPLSILAISYPTSSPLQFKIPPLASWSYKTTNKFHSLWQQEMTNFMSSNRWKIKASDFTTPQQITPRWYQHFVQNKPIIHHGYNLTRRPRLHRQRHTQNKKIRHKHIRKVKKYYPMYLSTKQHHSTIKKKYGHLHKETTEFYKFSTFKTTIVDGRPVYLPVDPLQGTTPVSILTPSTKPPNHRYYEMMKELDEGYMIVFLIELCRIISTKDPKHVKDVIMHTETIINELEGNGRLVWLDSPLLDVTIKLSRLISEAPIDLVRTYAAMLYHMLRGRKTTLSVEVNSIIDYAELMYEDKEGDYLFNSLREFEAFPEISKSGYLVCSTLIENFLSPFRRLHGTKQRQTLLDSINKAIQEKFPQISGKTDKEKDLKYGIKAKETQHWPKFRTILTSDESCISTSDSDSEIRRKIRRKRKQRRIRVHNLRKEARNRKRNKLNRRQMKNNDKKYLKFRSIEAITKTQRRYKIVSSKYHLKPTRERTTKSYTLNLNRRPTKDKSVTIAPPYVNTPFPYFHEQKDYFDTKENKVHQRADKKRRQRRPKQTIDLKKLQDYYYPFDEYFRQSEPKPVKGVGKITNTHLKRIVEASSYSDEEESLKKNLIEALFYNATATTKITKSFL